MSRYLIPLAALILILTLAALAKDYKGAEYRTKEAFTYGRFEVCYKPPKGDGFLASFFTYHEITSTKEWNEIDFEILGRYDHDVLVTSIGPGQKIRNSHQWVPFNTHEDFHRYAFEWTPDYIAWFIDGAEVYRQTQAHIAEFVHAQKIMMNIWPPSWEPWAGKLDDRALPVFAYYDWVSYASYTPGSGNTGTNNNFTLIWKDDFDFWDQDRWEKATHTFGGNNCDFTPENVVFKNGYLILCLTKGSPLGYIDLSPPAVQWVRALANKVLVGFTEDVDSISAQKKNNYIISGIEVTEAKLLSDHRTVALRVSGLDPGQNYQMIVLGVRDNSPARNMLTGQVINFSVAQPLSFPIKINVGGKAYRDFLPDQLWRPDLEYGHQDGYEDNWLGLFDIQGTEDDSVYLTGLHELVTYRVRVPNGLYKVTLMMSENEFNEPGRRSFDVIVESKSIIRELDLYQQIGPHIAHQIIADSIQVQDEIIDIHFTNRWNFSLLNGLMIEQIGSSAINGLGSLLMPHYFLSQNYPNPFNAITLIQYGLPETNRIKLELYNVLGQRIRTVLDDTRPAGIYHIQLDCSDLASGVYFYQMSTDRAMMRKKMLVMK